MSPPAKESAIQRLALALAFVGGAAALAHQLLWTRRLIDLLGASHESAARVLGVFFLGLALGSAAGGAAAMRWRNRWHALAWIELSIAATTVPLILLPLWSGNLWQSLGPDIFDNASAAWIKLALCLLLLGPPAFFMGFFLPMASEALRAGSSDLSRPALPLYAANTLGGVAGLLITATLAIHLLGMRGAMLAATALNGFVALGCFALARFDMSCGQGHPARPAPPDIHPEHPATSHTGLAWKWPVLAAFSGFSVLAVEVIILALLQLEVPLSFYGPAALLSGVILLLGLAAWTAALPAVRRLPTCGLLAGAMWVAGLSLVAAPHLFHWLAGAGFGPSSAYHPTGFAVRLVILLGISFALPLFAMGLIFPLLTRAAARSSGLTTQSWGKLLAINGLGAALGAELAYRVAMPVFGLHNALALTGLAYVLVGVATLRPSLRPSPEGAARFSSPLRVAAAVLALASLIVLWPRNLPLANPHLGLRVIDSHAGRDGVILVAEHPAFGKGLLSSNQYLLGSTSARAAQERQAHLPLLLHQNPQQVAFLGMATGSTPAAALAHEPVERVTAVEISPAVETLARRHFADLHGTLFEDPRTRVVVEDARTFIAAGRERFDVVVGDLFLPWGPGEARLYSREHFQAVHASLKPGGLFCQWLPGHQLTAEDLAAIQSSFDAAFGTSWLFAGGFDSITPSIALIGWRDGTPGPDWDVVASRCADTRRTNLVRDPVVRHVDALAMLDLGPSTWPASTRPNTLDNLVVELQAGRRRLSPQREHPYLANREYIAWLESLSLATPTAEAGRSLARRESAARAAGTPLFQSEDATTLWLELPSSLRWDSEADWSLWPGSLRPPR